MYAEEFKHTAIAQLLWQYAKQQAAETEAAVTHAAAAILPRPTSRAATYAYPASRGGQISTGGAVLRGASTRPRGGTR